MSAKILALYLDAPLQSWGYQSRFERRTSLSYPTRSGVLGMICAALGVDRSDVGGLRRLDDLHLTVLCFGGGARLEDYHTVGGGYDRKLEVQHVVRTASGKTGKTVLTYREYLQDARFGVLLRGDEALLEEIASALKDPTWGVWLGRKSCIPSSPVCQGTFESSGEAEMHLCSLEASRPSLRGQASPRHSRCFTEVVDFESGTDTLMDRPLDFSRRRFGPRRVNEE